MSDANQNPPLTDADKEAAALLAQQPAKNSRRAPVVNDDIALLAQYGLDGLPEVFAMRDPNGGQIIQERDACYQCMADGFYGRGTHGTWHQEGEILVMEIVPNQHLAPLNRAAGLAYANWLRRLPHNRAAIDVGDMAEAAQMLARNPEVTNLSPTDYQNAVIKLSEELKLRREGKDARSLPGLAHNFAPQSGGNSPPILGARMSDMTQRGPGFTAASIAATTGPGAVRRAQAAPSALGGTPPR